MESTLSSTIANTLKKIQHCTEKPENYLEAQQKIADDLTSSTKVLYDALKKTEETKSRDTLPTLLVDQYDDEQIWQQIDMQNNCGISSFIKQVSQVTAGTNGSFQTIYSTRTLETKPIKKTKHSKPIEPVEELDDISDGDSLGDVESLSHEEESNIFVGDGATESDDEEEMKKLLDKIHSSRNDDDDSDNDDSKAEEIDEEPSKKHSQAKKRVTAVDDKFFKISDLEEFLNEEDAREERRLKREERGEGAETSSEEEEYDLPDEEEEGFLYKDFFDPPDKSKSKKKKRKIEEEKDIDEEIDAEDDDEEEMDAEEEDSADREIDEEMEEDDSDGESVSDILGGKTPANKLSAFERRQLKMKEKIQSLEQAALAEKPWQLMGEATGAGRPQNSLLAENLDFEQTTKLPPVITEETTLRLEDIIKQRIKDKAWDDVERKVKTKETAQDYQRRLVLDQDKSKLSLSQIYEQEYLNKLQTDVTEKRDPQHEEIEKSMTALFKKLDALSNYHYTPKPAVAEVKVVSNVSSVTLEEVVPVGVSDAALLAPEEVKEKTKLIGDREKSGTDRRRERREKKKRQKDKAEMRERKQKAKERATEGGVVKRSKTGAMKELKKQAKSSRGLTLLQEKTSGKSDLSSSKKFFTQLQEEVTSHVQSRKAQARKKENKQKLTATKYML